MLWSITNANFREYHISLIIHKVKTKKTTYRDILTEKCDMQKKDVMILTEITILSLLITKNIHLNHLGFIDASIRIPCPKK